MGVIVFVYLPGVRGSLWCVNVALILGFCFSMTQDKDKGKGKGLPEVVDYAVSMP